MPYPWVKRIHSFFYCEWWLNIYTGDCYYSSVVSPDSSVVKSMDLWLACLLALLLNVVHSVTGAVVPETPQTGNDSKIASNSLHAMLWICYNYLQV